MSWSSRGSPDVEKFDTRTPRRAAPGPVLKAEASAAIVASTAAYATTATGWLALLAAQGHLAD